MRPLRVCNFCGTSELTVDYLLAGAGAFICSQCVASAAASIEAARHSNDASVPDARTLYRWANSVVVGQERAKRVFSVAVRNHYKRLGYGARGLRKSNVLILGPTGCGKTLLAQTMAQALNVPFIVFDVTGITQAGYAGDDVESVLSTLVREANGDVRAAERGIVFLDEVDKLAKRSTGGARRSLDVSGEGVQQSLLKIVEGAQVPLRANGPGTKDSVIDTTNILFIAAGAFPDLSEIVRDRLRSKRIGFTAATAESAPDQQSVAFDDLVEFGMIPEFLGRFPVICEMRALGEPELRAILTESDDALIPQYRTLLAMDQIDLHVHETAIHELARRAIELGTGARALRGLLEALLTDVMYHAPHLPRGTRLTVTGDDVAAGSVARLSELLGTHSQQRSAVPQDVRNPLKRRVVG